MKQCEIKDCGSFQYTSRRGIHERSNFALYIIRLAWEAGCDFEKESDGLDEQDRGWNKIRSSSMKAITIMLEKSCNYIERVMLVDVS